MTIHKMLLNDNDRINYTANHFGDNFPFRVEPFVFDMAGNLSREYTGGYWNFYELDNGGFYMSPDTDEPFRVDCMNGYTGTMSADAFGICVCLYAFSNLSFSDNPAFSEMCAEYFHLLRDYAFEHKEVDKILRAID